MMLLYFILGLLIFCTYKIYNLLKCPKELEHVPAVPIYTFFKFYFDKRSFAERVDFYFQPYFNKFGVIRVFSHVGWSLFVGEAKIAKEIFSKSDIFEKPDFKSAQMSENFKRFFGANQVVVLNGEEWKRQRKVINPIFNQTWNTELFGNCAQDLIDEWEKVEGSEVKINDKIQRMTLDVFGKAIFGIEFKAVKNTKSKLYNLYNAIADEVFNKQIYILLPFLEYLPFTRRPKLTHQLDEYHEFIQELIKSKKEDLKEGKLSKKGDLISAFIDSNENSQENKLSMEEIRDNLNGFIIAGHDTTSNTLMSTLYYLARYPENQAKLRAQVLEAMDNPNQVQIPTIDQLKNIPFMDMINKESMRIMTTVPLVQRLASSTYALSNGLVIPKDTYLFIHLWGIHHNPSSFPEPHEFNPNRFDDISNEESKHWQPFTLGNRTCIGTNFSLMEQRVTLAMLLQKFEFSISSENPDYQRLRVETSAIAYPKEVALTIKSRA